MLDERSIYVREDREDGASRGRSPKVNGETNGSFRERGSRATNGTAAADNAKVRLGLRATTLPFFMLQAHASTCDFTVTMLQAHDVDAWSIVAVKAHRHRHSIGMHAPW